MLIDSHTHLDRYMYRRSGKNLDSILQEIEEHEILTISNSLDVTSYKTNCKIAKKSKYVIPCFGIHPLNAQKYINKINLIEKLIRKSDIVGEIGLDYFSVKDECKCAVQKKMFGLFLSKTKDKLVSVHTKGAEKDVLRLLREYGNRKVIIHSFSGELDILDKMITEGYYFSITPEVRFSKHIKQIVDRIPLEKTLTETDNPGGPASYIGVNGTPVLIKIVVEEIARIKGKNIRQIERIVEDNFTRLYEQHRTE